MPLHHQARCIHQTPVNDPALQGTLELKTPDNDGTTDVIFAPLDFIARLVALVPEPRAHLTRLHGEFAPNSKYRMQVPEIHQ